SGIPNHMPSATLCRVLDSCGCSYAEFAEISRHSFDQSEPADAVFVYEQSGSKEALSAPGRGSVGSLFRAVFRISRRPGIFAGFVLEEDLSRQRVQPMSGPGEDCGR